MTEKTNENETWEEVIVDFFAKKIQCKLFKARLYIEKKEKEIKAERDEKKLHRAIEAKEKKMIEYEQLRKDAPASEIRQWLDATAKKKITSGKRIIKATHVLRFTHSSSDSGGVIVNGKSDDSLLTTSSIKKHLSVDLAHNNGALISISRFLALSFQGKHIIDHILDDDFCFLKAFAHDDSQLVTWAFGFRRLVEERELRSADKAKQLYFPLNDQTLPNEVAYHIIAPLFPSSLTHEIDLAITATKYGSHLKEIRKAKNEQSPKYRKEVLKNFPNLAVVQFGGEHPKNVSMLNADRSGKAFLFSTQPPNWQKQFKPPLSDNSMFFSGLIYHSTKENLEFLRNFLVWQQKANLSIKNPKRKQWIDDWVNQVIDEVMVYAINIQNMPAGWSNTENIRLKPAHQYFLDPYRDDKPFQEARQANDWQNVICADFANWLNGRLTGKEKQFTPQPEHTRLWKRLMKKELREQAEALEWDIKEQNREQQA